MPMEQNSDMVQALQHMSHCRYRYIRPPEKMGLTF